MSPKAARQVTVADNTADFGDVDFRDRVTFSDAGDAGDATDTTDATDSGTGNHSTDRDGRGRRLSVREQLDQQEASFRRVWQRKQRRSAAAGALSDATPDVIPSSADDASGSGNAGGSVDAAADGTPRGGAHLRRSDAHYAGSDDCDDEGEGEDDDRSSGFLCCSAMTWRLLGRLFGLPDVTPLLALVAATLHFALVLASG
jgi:hypothetical protein